MWVLETIAVALGMFSTAPIPQPVWSERNMRYALCAFPLAGALCAAGWWGWLGLCAALKAPAALRAGGLCILPVLVTGGIHLDGYADTCDALALQGEAEKRQAVLKDPRCGAFAVIRLCTYFTAYFALCAALPADRRSLACMGAAFMLERALSGFSIAAFPLARDTGLAHTFASGADRRRVRGLLLVGAALLALFLLWQGGWAGGGMLLALLFALWRYHRVAVRQFGGISGDLAGWFLQRAELYMLGALVFCRLVEECL